MKLALSFLLILFLFCNSYSITKQEIIELVKEDILKKSDIDSVNVEIYSPLKKIEPFRDEKYIVVTKLSHGFKRSQKFKLIGDGFSRKLTFNINFYKKIPVAKISLKKGEIISESNISYKLVNISTSKNFVLNKNSIVGKLTKRSFKEGEYFQKASLKDIPLVRKDSDVKVVVDNGIVNLSFETKAFSSGYKGERIYFRNPFSGELQLGTVIALNLVKL